MKKIKLVIFDFDGCIADVELIVKLAALDLASKYIKTKINFERVLRKEGMRSLIKKSGVSYWRIPVIVRKFRKLISKDFTLVKPYQGIKPLLQKLEKDYILGIVTSNSKPNVNKFLKRNSLDKKFKFSLTNISLFTKSWWLKRIIKKHKLQKSEVVMIGDEVRDIEAAKKAGIKSIAVTWGLNTRTLLKKSNPDYIVQRPSQIFEIIKKL